MAINYYLVLGITPESTQSQIHRAFRRLCHEQHPDRSRGDPAQFLRLKEAYDTLRNPIERRRHDAELAAAPPPPPPTPRVVARSPIDLFTDFGQLEPSADEILQAFARNFLPQHQPKTHHMRDLNIQITLTPDEAAHGGVLPLSVPIFEPCSLCEGTGKMGFAICEACDGKGSAQSNAPVDVLIPRHVTNGSSIPVSLGHLGIHNMYLNVQIQVAGASPYA